MVIPILQAEGHQLLSYHLYFPFHALPHLAKVPQHITLCC